MKKEYIRPTDYEQRERPKTRAKQFFDIFRHRFLELLKLSLLQAVFSFGYCYQMPTQIKRQ